jgi:hypothetical protein
MGGPRCELAAGPCGVRAESVDLFFALNIRSKSLIRKVEATTRIELVYTVLQFACGRPKRSPLISKWLI